MADRFLIQGHRGAGGLQPGNTLPSFEVALAAGVGSIETDVHLSADGVPVLIHDPVVPDGIAVRSRSAEQLAAAGIPSLAELYQLVAGNPVIIDVEIKCVPYRHEPVDDTVERAVLDVIRTADAADRTWIRSFDHRRVRRLRQMEPRLVGVVLIEGTAPVDPVALVKAADAQVYAPDYLFLDEEQVRQCHTAGIKVLPWTVNDPADWTRLSGWGVDGITTDYPDRLAAWLAQPPANARYSRPR